MQAVQFMCSCHPQIPPPAVLLLVILHGMRGEMPACMLASGSPMRAVFLALGLLALANGDRCESWCSGVSSVWDEKCTWDACDDCAECLVSNAQGIPGCFGDHGDCASYGDAATCNGVRPAQCCYWGTPNRSNPMHCQVAFAWSAPP